MLRIRLPPGCLNHFSNKPLKYFTKKVGAMGDFQRDIQVKCITKTCYLQGSTLCQQHHARVDDQAQHRAQTDQLD